MKIKKTIAFSTLFSALALVGCGGDTASTDPNTEGSTDPNPTSPNPTDPAPTDPGPAEPPEFGFVDYHSAKISGDIQAAVKAATFVKYESDVANYQLLFNYISDYSSQSGDFLVEQLKPLAFVSNKLKNEGITDEGSCGGTLFAQGTVPGVFEDQSGEKNINFDANQYCTQLEDSEGNLTGDELTLTGQAHLIVNDPNYSLELTDTVTHYNAFDESTADVTVAINGTINHSETASSNQLAVNADVTFDGIAGSYNFTHVCQSQACVINAQVTPGDGNQYTIDGLTVSLNNGYQGSADISYDQVIGELTVSFDQIQYCEDGTIASGTMSISENNGTADILTSFNGCGVEPSVEFYSDGAP